MRSTELDVFRVRRSLVFAPTDKAFFSLSRSYFSFLFESLVVQLLLLSFDRAHTQTDKWELGKYNKFFKTTKRLETGKTKNVGEG